jgi:predicted deacylase
MSTPTTPEPRPNDGPPWLLPAPDVAPWREGNTGTQGVWSFEASQPGPHVLVTALIHGNELCGAWAVRGALEAGLRPRRGTLTLALCNLAAFDRFDPAKPYAARYVDEDINRVWGDALTARPPSVEQRRALELLPFVERADWLLDLHSMSEAGPPVLLTGLLPRNLALARELGAPELVIADAGHAQGRRMRDHGRFADADGDSRALLLECGQHGELASREVALDGLARFLVASGCLLQADVPAAWWRPRPPTQRVCRVTDAIAAKTVNVRFAQRWTTGQVVPDAGTVLGWDDGAPFVTPYPHCLLVMPSLRNLKPGVTVLRLARAA